MLHRRRGGRTEESGQEDETESRSAGASQAAELALVPVGGKDPKEREVGEGSSQKKGSTQKGQLEIEDIPKGPVGQPEVLGPKKLEPLFNRASPKSGRVVSTSSDVAESETVARGIGWEWMGKGSGQWGSSWISARHGVGGSWERDGGDIAFTRVTCYAHACTFTHVHSTHGSTGISTWISSNACMDRRSNEDSSSVAA